MTAVLNRRISASSPKDQGHRSSASFSKTWPLRTKVLEPSKRPGDSAGPLRGSLLWRWAWDIPRWAHAACRQLEQQALSELCGPYGQRGWLQPGDMSQTAAGTLSTVNQKLLNAALSAWSSGPPNPPNTHQHQPVRGGLPGKPDSMVLLYKRSSSRGTEQTQVPALVGCRRQSRRFPWAGSGEGPVVVQMCSPIPVCPLAHSHTRSHGLMMWSAQSLPAQPLPQSNGFPGMPQGILPLYPPPSSLQQAPNLPAHSLWFLWVFSHPTASDDCHSRGTTSSPTRDFLAALQLQ